MQETQLPIDLVHWLLAFSPLLVLLFLLIVVRWKAPEAGPIGMFLAAGIAIFIYPRLVVDWFNPAGFGRPYPAYHALHVQR